MVKFPAISYATPEWFKIKEELKRQLEILRKENENGSYDLAQTNLIRGKIQQIRIILGWEDAALEKTKPRN